MTLNFLCVVYIYTVRMVTIMVHVMIFLTVRMVTNMVHVMIFLTVRMVTIMVHGDVLNRCLPCLNRKGPND